MRYNDTDIHHVCTGVRSRLCDLAMQAKLRDPDELANQLLLLIDGAWVAARMYGPGNSATALSTAAGVLIAAHR